MASRGKTSFLILAASVAIATSAPAVVLYDNSNITTGVGNGFNGANISAVAPNSATYGYSANSIVGPMTNSSVQLAEDFTLSATSLVSVVTFDAYSTSTYPSPPASPFTGATVSLWNAQPGTAGATVLFTSTTLAATAWTGVYRVTSTTLTNAQRPVFTLSVGFNNVSLAAGTYWASYAVTSIVAPGATGSVFSAPLMNADGTEPAGNAIQSMDGGTTWAATTDNNGSGITNRLPLSVNGTAAVPEPATVTLTVLIGLMMMVTAARRKFKKSALVVAAGWIGLAASAQATVLTFDDGSIAAGATLSNQYASLGVVFAPGGGNISGVVNPAASTQGFATNTSMTIGLPGATVAAPISGNVLPTRDSFFLENGDPVFTMTFSSAVTFLSLDLGNNSSTQAVLFAVDPATGTAVTLASSVGTVATPTNATVTAVGIPAGATTFVVVPGSFNDYVAVDNINFTLAAVPEPSTWALLGLGVGGLGLVLRRRATRA